MNVDNENIEPVTDLGLALSYSNQYVQRRSNNDSGAGANAGSRIDMTFVANDPLSELVWSPHKGPSNVALSPPQSNTDRRSATEKPMDEENFLTPVTSFHLKNEVTCKDTSTKSPKSDSGVMQLRGLTHEHEKVTGGEVEEMNTNLGISVLHINQKDELGNSEEDNISGQANRNNDDILSARSDQLKPDAVQTDLLSGDPIVGDRDVNSCKHTLQLDLGLTSGVNTVIESAFAASVPNRISQDTRHLEKMESTAENDIQYSKCEYACGATTNILSSEFAPEVKDNSQQDEEKVPRNNTSLVEHSPTNSRIHMRQRKGKEKALSDGDLKGRMSRNEDDSHESVESCNSAGLSSTGKKRWSYEEDLIVGNKRLKKQTECTNGSTSIVRQDSSFMNWISNMMKGFSKSMQDDAPPFALTLPHPFHKHENPDKKIITCSKNQEPGLKNIGFQSIFQSLYCPKSEGQEARMLNTNYQIGEGSKELEPANKVCDINATPIACHGNLGRQLFLLNDRFNESTSGNEVESTIRPRIWSERIAGCQEKGDTNSAENKNTSNLACSKEEETSSNSSLGKQKASSGRIADFDAPLLGKTPLKYRTPLASLWITRFASKTIGNPGPSSTLDQAGEAPKCSTECLKPPHSQNHVDFLNVHKFVEAKENSAEHPLIVTGKDSQYSAAENEGYMTMNRIKSYNDYKSINKFNPILPSPKLKISEAMASLFARRLDAIKHILPAKETDNAALANMTCYFCGIKGHSLQNCSEISETELEQLLKNLNRYSGAEELPSLCIRCFKHSHWAIACPKASLTTRRQLESNISLDNPWCPSEVQLNARNEENAKLQIGKGSQFHVAVANTSCHGDDLRIETDFSWKVNERVVCKEKRPCASSAKKHIASESGENKLKENQIMPLSHVLNTQIADAPRGLFDAVKRLRLPRTDILKWMNSHKSLSHLNGFFLRLRLGKREEGLGGTKYYVACITGTQRESVPQDAKSLSVNVGGISCLVESQYVSNHDFLEDELIAWWSETSRNGDNAPSEEDLRNRIKRKRMLGF